MSGPVHRIVRYSHQTTCSRCPLDLHLHDSDTLAYSRQFALECENSSMVVIVDRDGSGVGFAEGCDGGRCSGFQSNRMSISPPDYAGVAQADMEVFIFFKDVIINNANCYLFKVFAGFENQCALRKFVVGTSVGCAILCAVVNLYVDECLKSSKVSKMSLIFLLCYYNKLYEGVSNLYEFLSFD